MLGFIFPLNKSVANLYFAGPKGILAALPMVMLCSFHVWEWYSASQNRFECGSSEELLSQVWILRKMEEFFAG